MKVEYQIIKRKDNFCNDEHQFISLLETNQNYKIIREEKILEYKELSIGYDIRKYETEEKKEIMLVIVFSVEDEANIEEFEKFDKSLLGFLSKFNDFSLNILWDDISKKYAEEMYPKIFHIENLLRKIIYYFMGKNVGNNWTKKCFPKGVASSIENVKDKNQAKTDENILYHADFIQLSYLLFMKYPNEFIDQDKFIESLKDKKYSIYEMVSKYEYKSNWDRYFEPVVKKENLESDLNSLYHYRNLVAHNRKIREIDKNKAESLISKIKIILDICLSKIDEIEVPEDEKENLENMSYQIYNKSPIDFLNLGVNSADILGINQYRGVESDSDSLKSSDMLGIGSIGKYLGMNSEVKSLKDSLKSSDMFGIDSIGKYLGMNSEVKSLKDSLESSDMFGIDSIGKYLGMNSEVKSLKDSLKSSDMLGINSMGKYLGINSEVKSTIDFDRVNLEANDKEILAMNSEKISTKKRKKTKKEDEENDGSKNNV